MARAFASASSQFLENSNSPVSAMPLTLSCWFKLTTAGAWEFFASLCEKTTNYYLYGIGLNSSALACAAHVVNNSAATASVGATPTTGVWYHLAGVFVSTTERKVYLDGTESSDSNSKTALTPDSTFIACVSGNSGSEKFYMNGQVAEVAVWNTDLSQATIRQLAAGISPLAIQPQNLAFYMAGVRDNDEDIVGGLSLTASGSPTIAAHPPVYCLPPLWTFDITAGGAVHNLVVQDGEHTHSGDSLHLSQDQFLIIADGEHTQSGDSPHLSQDQFLSVADGEHTHLADNIILVTAGIHILVVQDGQHTHSGDSPHLSQDQFIIVADGQHTHSGDSPHLSQDHFLVIADGEHTHSGDSPHLSQAQFLVIADGEHTHLADSPHLSQDQFITIQDGEHQHISDGIILDTGEEVLLVRPRSRWPFWSQ